MSELVERGELIITRVQVETLYRERADLETQVATLEAREDELQHRLDALIEVEAVYWRALTDVLIGAQEQSQSHADVIARVSDALITAGTIVPLEERAGWRMAQDGQDA
jgi:hypothetical protein